MEWKNQFTPDVLDKSKDYIESIYEVKISDNQINANLKKSSHFHVHISLNEDEISYMHCTCSSKSNCKHQAAVLEYIEENNLIEKEAEYKQLLKSVDENILKEYLADLFYENPNLKKDFIRKFKKQPRIDANPYFEKLNQIIESAKGSDYYNFGYYDIDVLAQGLELFIDNDIVKLIEIYQYEIAFELLEEMSSALNDEMYVDEDSWYDVCEKYCEIAYCLEETYVLTHDQLDKLKENCSFMRNYM